MHARFPFDRDPEARSVLDDVRSILERLRPRDARELDELGIGREEAAQALAANGVLARVFRHGSRAEAVVAFHQLTPKALAVSLMATDAWPLVAAGVLRWGLREAGPALIARGYERAECRTMEGHDAAVALIERLGFVCECRLARFGAQGAAFLQYAWRLSDHVPVQSAKSPAAAPAAADTGLRPGGGVARAAAPRAQARALRLALRAQSAGERQSDRAKDASGDMIQLVIRDDRLSSA